MSRIGLDVNANSLSHIDKSSSIFLFLSSDFSLRYADTVIIKPHLIIFCHTLAIFESDRLSIIIKLCPTKKTTVLLPWHIPCMTHPKISTPILSPSFRCHNPQHSWHPTRGRTPRGVSRMKGRPVVPVGNVNAPFARNRMRVYGLCGGDAVFPTFLHVGVHD